MKLYQEYRAQMTTQAGRQAEADMTDLAYQIAYGTMFLSVQRDYVTGKWHEVINWTSDRYIRLES